MPTFSYDAKDSAGQSVSGLIEAAEPSGAAASLREQGLFPTRIEAMRGGSAASVTADTRAPRLGTQSRIDVAPFLVSVPLNELAVMYRQLATLLNAGVPMVQALTTLANQTRHGRLKSILTEAANTVAGGSPLSSVMERYPSVFTTLQIELIRAGEYGGLLEQMCHRLANYLERELETRRKLKRETLYPKIVLFVAALVILILAFVQSGMGQSGVAAVVARVRFAAIVGALMFGAWWAARYLNQFPGIGAAWDRIKMLIPAVGGVVRRYATARFCRALGALYAGGVNVVRAVEIASRACGNRAIGQRLLDATPALAAGEGLSGVLARSGLLEPIAVQMARTGEQTGSLDNMMEKVADYLESEADTKAHQLAVIAGVVMLLLAALVVGFIVISFYVGQFTSVMRESGA